MLSSINLYILWVFLKIFNHFRVYRLYTGIVQRLINQYCIQYIIIYYKYQHSIIFNIFNLNIELNLLG